MSCRVLQWPLLPPSTDDLLGEPPQDDEDKFGELFDKFMSMKGNDYYYVAAHHSKLLTETAKSLPHEQRKEFAEKVCNNNQMSIFDISCFRL